MSNPNHILALYNSLIKIEEFPKKTYEQFSADMGNEFHRKALYNSLIKIKEFPKKTYEQFSADIGFGATSPLPYVQASNNLPNFNADNTNSTNASAPLASLLNEKADIATGLRRTLEGLNAERLIRNYDISQVKTKNDEYNVINMTKRWLANNTDISLADRNKYVNLIKQYEELDQRQKENNLAVLNQNQKNIKPQLDVLQGKLAAELKKEADKSKGSYNGFYNYHDKYAAPSSHTSNNLHIASKYLNSAEETLFAPHNSNNDKLSSMWKGAKDNFSAAEFITFGLDGLFSSIATKNIIEKSAAGNALSESESLVMDALLQKQLIDLIRANDISKWYKGGQTAEGSLEVMAQFFATGSAVNPFGKLATKGVKNYIKRKVGKEVTEEVLERYLAGMLKKNAGKRIVLKTADKLGDMAVGGTVQGLLMPNIYKTAVEASSPTVAGKNGNGQYDVAPAEKSFLEGMLLGIGEATSERSGFIFSDMFKGGNKILRGLVSKLPPKVRNSTVGNALSWVNNTLKTGNRYLAKTGFNGMPEELLEEVFKNERDYIYGLTTKEEHNDFWSRDNIETMLIGFAPMSAFGGVMNAGEYGKFQIKQNQAEKALTQILLKKGINKSDIEGYKLDLFNLPIDQLKNSVYGIIKQAGGTTASGRLNKTGQEISVLIAEYMQRTAQVEAAKAINTEEDIKKTEEDIGNRQKEVFYGEDTNWAALNSNTQKNFNDIINPLLPEDFELDDNISAEVRANTQQNLNKVSEALNGSDYQLNIGIDTPIKVLEDTLLNVIDAQNLSDSQKQSIVDLIHSIGVERQIRAMENERDSSAIEAARAEMENSADPSRGTVTVANIKTNGEEKQNVIIKGLSIKTENGKFEIDWANSDDVLYYINESGEVIPMDAASSSIHDVVSSLPLADALNTAVQETESRIGQRNEAVNFLTQQYLNPKEITEEQIPLTEQQAVDLITQMEANAVDAPQLELTPENWYAEFGGDGLVQTPLGKVKMGENQYLKLQAKNRGAEFGMIKPTLTNPDVILEVASEAKDRQETERPSSYLFIKSFVRNGEKIRHFETVTVSKDGFEVVVSSHIIKPAQLKSRLLSGNVRWSKYELSNSEISDKFQTLDGQFTQNPNEDAHGSNVQRTVSSGKDTKNTSEAQTFLESLPRKKNNDLDFASFTPEQIIAFSEYSNNGNSDAVFAEIKGESDRLKQEITDKTAKLKEKSAKFLSLPLRERYAQQGQFAGLQAEIEALQAEKAVYDNYLAPHIEARQRQREEQEALQHQRRAEAAKEREEIEAAEKAEKLRRQKEGYKNDPDFIAIQERFKNTKRVKGRQRTIILSNGEHLSGHYELVEAGVAATSHDPFRHYAQTVGFPRHPDGKTLNNRDYEKDTDAQALNRERAVKYDKRALQEEIFVTPDGIVISGTDRTMAGNLAASNNADGKYNAALSEDAAIYGFTPEQTAEFEHPRLIFVLDETPEYSVQTFKKFNEDGKKSQGIIAKAENRSSTISGKTIRRLNTVLSQIENFDNFYNNQTALKEVFDILVEDGVIGNNELPELMINGKYSALYSKAKLEPIILGIAFDAEQIGNVLSLRRGKGALMKAILQIIENKTYGEYSINEQLNNAISLLMRAQSNNHDNLPLINALELEIRQINMFEADSRDIYSEAEEILARAIIDDKISKLNTIFAAYNAQAKPAANGQQNFFENVTKESILINISKQYGTESTINRGSKTDNAQERGSNGGGSVGNRTASEGEPRNDGSRGSSGVAAESKLDQNGLPFVAVNGNIDLGTIKSETGLAEAPIRLSEGTEYADGKGYGIAHIEKEHGKQIRDAGYNSIGEFVANVASNYTTIRKGNPRGKSETYLLEVTDKHNNTLFVELSKDGSYWNVNSAGIFNERYSAKKDVVWTLPAVSNSANADTAGVNHGQNEGATVASGNSPKTTDKSTENISDLQEIDKKIAEIAALRAIELNSPSEISDEEFTNPKHDVKLPSLPENILTAIGSKAKPVLIKKNIFEKNRDTHTDLTAQQSREILTNALYNPNIAGQSQPKTREHYYIAIKTGDNKHSTVVIDVLEKKDNIEVVGWHYTDNKGIEKLKRQAEREGGQFLILSPKDGSAAALSALPSGLSSGGKGTENISDLQAAVFAAEKETDVNPTEAQKKAGNYKKGHVKIQGFDISIEQPKGSIRRGVDENGKAWETEMHNIYGYFGNTESRDGDHIDLFLGGNPLSGKVFVIDQINPETKEFDEHKVMFGFNSIEEAREAYLSNYEDGWQGLGNITEANIDAFRKWAEMDGKRIKPFAEYKSNQPEITNNEVNKNLNEQEKEQLEKRYDELKGAWQELNKKLEVLNSKPDRNPVTGIMTTAGKQIYKVLDKSRKIAEEMQAIKKRIAEYKSNRSETDTLHQRILTPQLKRKIHAAVEAAYYEGNPADEISFEYDKELSLFGDTLTPEEYNRYSPEKAEEIITAEIARQAQESGHWNNGVENIAPPVRKRNIYIPKMTASRLEKLLSKQVEELTENNKEDLLDYKYFLLNQQQDAFEKGLMDSYKADQKKPVYVPKNKHWITNIDNATKGFESKYWIDASKGDTRFHAEQSEDLEAANEEKPLQSPLTVKDINGTHKVIDLNNTPELQKYLLNKDVTPEDVKEFQRWLKGHREDYVRLYHGTASSNPITEKGILRTGQKRRKSLQSESGYVYLSRYPDASRFFGEYNNNGETTVYAVDVKIKDLLPDTDQLRNRRMEGREDLGDTLAESLIFGNGARLKRDIKPYEVSATRFQTQNTDLEAVNGRFNEELNGVKNGTYKGILHLGKPLETLQASGLKAGEIELASEVLEKHLKKHNLTTDDLQNLANAIQDPIIVYEWGTKSPATVIVTELTTKDGRKITVALRAENKGRKLDVTEVASVHGKAAERFLSEMENAKEGGLEKALRYVEKGKALDWLGLSTLSTSQGLNSIAKIIQNFENPKLKQQNKFRSVSRAQWEKIIELLKKTGLARNVITDRAKMREYLEKY
ncbi:MAG: hypothetical protein LBB53_05750, partial [Prevotellaceae bacterium]|nr:hypothetical protein [Prevotellaceae bacterium]